jgi:hypothetical protein
MGRRWGKSWRMRICDLGASVAPTVFDQAAKFGDLLRVSRFAELDDLLVDFGAESVRHVEDTRNTSLRSPQLQNYNL